MSRDYDFVMPWLLVPSTPDVLGRFEVRLAGELGASRSADARDALVDDRGYNQDNGVTFIAAKTDVEAVCVFLEEYRHSSGTLRSYAKELERLVLWCVYERRVTISDLRRDDLLAYQDFMQDPQPRALWCGPTVSRYLKGGEVNPAWRPYVKGMGKATVSKALTILDSFFNYLVASKYLVGNPLAVDRSRRRRHRAVPAVIDRYLELDEIHAVLDALASIEGSDESMVFAVIRARYLVLLLFYTGLRISEASGHGMKDFVQREGNWFLKVVGKGEKPREIPIPDELLDALASFRLAVGLDSAQPTFAEPTPLIPMKNLVQSISVRRIDQILSWAFECGAQRVEVASPHKASKLRAASAHWLRHSYVTYLLDTGAPLKVAQENAGHSDVSTTMHYRHVAQEDRHEATQALSVSRRKKDEG